MSLPDFLVIGTMRSGTSWLDYVMRSHPEIYLPTHVKELHFFNRHFKKGIEYYESNFPGGQEAEQYEAIGEITPNNLYYPGAAKRIYEYIPDCKLIAILRNPVDRAYSHYGFSRTYTNEQLSFDKYLEQNPIVFNMGKYHSQLKRYLQYFNKSQILIFIFEELMNNKKQGLNNLADFIDVDSEKFNAQHINNVVANSYLPRVPKLKALFTQIGRKLRKNELHFLVNLAKKANIHNLFGSRGKLPELPSNTRKRLIGKYEKEIEGLEQLLNRSLDIWRK